jgi:hypothetical protein
MVMELLTERVTRLEEQMKHQSKATEDLTTAVKDLTGVLQQSRGAYKFLGTLIAVTSVISGGVAWLATKVSIVFNNPGGLP